MNGFSRYTFVIDKFAVSTSALCAVHCLALPLMIGVFPAMGATFFGQEAFHEILLWAVIPMTVVSLTMGCKRHKSLPVALLGLAGLAVLIFTVIMGHDGLGETMERNLTLLGASIIAAAHIMNFKLCRQKDCEC